MTTPKCPSCGSEYTYELSDTTFGCSECGAEFTEADLLVDAADKFIVLDSVGTELSDGDDVIIIQDLPVKGMPKPIKKGTKAKNIRINESGKNGHYIDAKIDGFGAMGLKGSVVKKG
ncbi:zinc ribbon domain-containing protein YjdM [Pseudolactococcus insecticola]|uniref:Alkylphosphonate transporter n=1 Tax=Pseudolactococcus insecticola TaxID=2709158 RepID=A0A6A0B9P0_9LACT|nr:zinc ribbon domain-containing protein YjdM [Lactococcus insecticola]GFH41064.1 alkylphosphonate transporter [Lactococcus insecticola]